MLDTASRDCPILALETLTIQEVIRTAIRTKVDSIILKNDFELVLCSIIAKIVVPKQISNLLNDIKLLAMNIKNFTFVYCNWITNSLTDR